jgi:RNA polymerase-binding transcription factor DksA
VDAAALLDIEETETRERIDGLQGDLDLYDAAIGATTDDEHDPEGTTAYDRARTSALLDAGWAHLGEIEAARERLAAGRYGTCESCGKPIATARLQARPVARTCIGCA